MPEPIVTRWEIAVHHPTDGVEAYLAIAESQFGRVLTADDGATIRLLLRPAIRREEIEALAERMSRVGGTVVVVGRRSFPLSAVEPEPRREIIDAFRSVVEDMYRVGHITPVELILALGSLEEDLVEELGGGWDSEAEDDGDFFDDEEEPPQSTAHPWKVN